MARPRRLGPGPLLSICSLNLLSACSDDHVFISQQSDTPALSPGMPAETVAPAPAEAPAPGATPPGAPASLETPETPQMPSLPPPADTAPPSGAVLIGVFVGNPDGRNIYVGAVPEVPQGELDYSRFLEFGNVDVYVHGGYAYVWDRETVSMTRLRAREDLSLVQDGERVSFLNFGLTGGQFDGGDPVFLSPTRAYVLSAALDGIAVWNPTTMEILGTLPMTPPEVPAGFTAFAHKSQIVGDNVIWQVVATHDEQQLLHPVTTLAIVSAVRDEPVRYVSDERCAGANGGYVDARGDYYVRADGYWGRYVAYADPGSAPQTCILRVRAGETTFDPDYLLPLEELTGSRINFPWFHVSGSQYVAWAWDPAATPPPNPDDYWSAPNFRPLLVDIEARTSQPYPDLEGTIIVQSAERELDGVKYYEWSEVGYADALHADIVELRPEGIVRKFSLPSLWAFGRLR